MRIPETKIKPLKFKDTLGKPLNIFTTTFTGFAYSLFIISCLAVLLEIALTIALIKEYHEEIAIYAIIGSPLILLPFYIYLGNRYRYIALFSEGLVVKKRFRFKVIKYNSIEKIEFKESGSIDLFLSNGKFVSFGESCRIFKSVSFFRYFTGVRILNIIDLYTEIKNKI